MKGSHAKPGVEAADSAMTTCETMRRRTFGIGQEQLSNGSNVPVRVGSFSRQAGTLVSLRLQRKRWSLVRSTIN